MPVKRLLIFTVIMLSSHYYSYSQSIKTDKNPQRSLIDVLEDIAEKYQISIIYNPSIFEELRSNNSVGETLQEELFSIIDISKFDLVINDRSVLIKKLKTQTKEISGYIKQEQSGITLPYALVKIRDQDSYAVSDENGYFQISGRLPYAINVSYLGHRDTSIFIDQNDTRLHEIRLRTENYIEEVIVDERNTSSNETHRYYYHGERVRKLTAKLPGIGGNNDILHATKGIAGITTGNGGIGGYFIRGGNNSQNLFLLDGVAIYNPFHSFGLTSIFTSDISQNLEVVKSGFKPHYIDKSAGIIDIKVREGNEDKLYTSANLNTQDGALYLHGPIFRDHTTFFLGARSTTVSGPFNNAIRDVIYGNTEAENQTKYQDYILKIKSKISDKSRLEFTFYKGDDQINGELEQEGSEQESEQKLKWGNEAFSLKWMIGLKDNLFWSARVSGNEYYTDYKTINEFDDENMNLLVLDNSSLNRDFNWDTRIDWLLNPAFRIKTGISQVSKEFSPDLNIFTEDSDELEGVDRVTINDIPESLEVEELESQLLTWYTEASFESRKNKLSFGYRLNSYQSESLSQFDFLPRISWNHFISEKNSIELSLSSTAQYEHILSVSDIFLPQDIWHPAIPELLPEKGWHYNLAHTWSNNRLKVRSEAYYRNIKNITFSSLTSFDDAYQNFNLYTIQGNSESFGLEFSGHVSLYPHELIFSYALSKSSHQFDELNLGGKFPSPFDRLSELNILGSFKLSNVLSLGFAFNASTGHPRLVVDNIDEELGIVPFEINPPGSKNETRNGWSHRMDLSLTYLLNSGPLSHHFKLNLYNSYNATLPLFYRNTNGVLEPDFSLPAILSFSYTIKF